MRKQLFAFAILFQSVCFGQNPVDQQAQCGTTFSAEQETKRLQFEEQIQNQKPNKLAKITNSGLLVIPVVIHILWHNEAEKISDALVYQQLDELNRCFGGNNENLKNVPNSFKNAIGNPNIVFCLANKDPKGFSTNGIVKKQVFSSEFGLKDSNLFYSSLGGDDAWDNDYYLNIWVVDLGKYISGYGIYPWAATPSKSGVVIHPKYIGFYNNSNNNYGHTLVHEMGHFLGLYHTWMDDKDCNKDDGIDDTPLQEHPYYGFPSFPQYSCNSSDLFMNFMDYVDDDAVRYAIRYAFKIAFISQPNI